MNSLQDLFRALLQNVYFFGQQLFKTLPKFAWRSADAKLRRAFADDHPATENRLDRLRETFVMTGEPAKGRRNDIVVGIIAAGDEIVTETADQCVRDAGVLAAA